MVDADYQSRQALSYDAIVIDLTAELEDSVMELHDPLKPREIEILRLMADGLTNREIGERLYIGFETVKWYAKQIYSKLDVSSREDASAKAQSLGLLEEAQPSDTPQPSIRPQHNLPTQLTSFIGRETHIEAIKNLLIDTRLLTLTGPGGTGKTRLSIRIAQDLLNDFADGVYFVDLAPIDNSENIPKAIATALAVLENTDESLVDTLKRSIGERHVLLVIDNFEHVMGGASIVSDLLTGTVNLKVIVTSREALRLIGEQEYPIPPLDLGEQDSEAVTLFVQRAQLVRPSFRLDDSNKDDIVSICQRVDGLPLAIELAAARCKLLTPQALLKRLDNRLTSLTGGSRDAPQRQQTLQATIDWSYDLLDDDEKQLFERLSVFRGGRSLEAIESICAEGLQIDLFDGLVSLVDKSIIHQVEDNLGEPRFMMLETIQEYAQQRLEERGELSLLRDGHATYYMKLAERAAPELRLKHQEYWYTKLNIEYRNLATAMDWAFMGGDGEIGVLTVINLRDYWWYQGLHGEGWHWILHGLEHIDDIPKSSQADLFLATSIFAYLLRQVESCVQFADKAYTIYLEMNDLQGIAWTQPLRSSLLPKTKQETQQAVKTLYESLNMLRSINDLPGQAQLLNNLGITFRFYARDYVQARKCFEEGIQISHITGDKRRAIVLTGNLAEIALCMNRLNEVRQLLKQTMLDSLDVKFGYMLYSCMWTCIQLFAIREQFLTATRLYGSVNTQEQLTGQLLNPDYIFELSPILKTIDDNIRNSEEYAEQYEIGRKMSLDEAIDFALQELED